MTVLCEVSDGEREDAAGDESPDTSEALADTAAVEGPAEHDRYVRSFASFTVN